MHEICYYCHYYYYSYLSQILRHLLLIFSDIDFHSYPVGKLHGGFPHIEQNTAHRITELIGFIVCKVIKPSSRVFLS